MKTVIETIFNNASLKNQLTITEDRVNSRNSSRNSMVNEILSHYSYTDSDLHDFQKMERDIYGSHGDDESSQEHDVNLK